MSIEFANAIQHDDGRLHLQLENEANELLRSFELEGDLPQPPNYTPHLEYESKPRRIPKMSILMLAIGSRGDIQPFIALALALKQYGHRIRLATHPTFKSFVEQHNLEFFDLQGDPKELMSYMVRNPGLLPGFTAIHTGELGGRRKMMESIINACWHSCFESGPQSMPRRIRIGRDSKKAELSVDKGGPAPFVADAIIANPPSLGHLHCAQALSIPLHIFFT